MLLRGGLRLISRSNGAPQRGRQMEVVRRDLTLRALSSSPMQRQQRDWWWLAPSVRKQLYQERFCREWIWIAEPLSFREPTCRGEAVLADRPEQKIPGIP